MLQFCFTSWIDKTLGTESRELEEQGRIKMIYFDNAASTKPAEAVIEKITESLRNYYANPSAQSSAGFECEKLIRNAAKTMADLINAKPDEIYFTSGGTEGDNWAIFGTAEGYARSGKHIITTSFEHAGVTAPCERLEKMGYEITYLKVDEKGYIDLNELENAIREDTILVSIIFINNEVGTIQDMEKIGKIIKAKNPETLFHTDAVQAFGKVKIDVKKMNIDMLSMSGHKIHAPKGVGMFYMKNGLKVKPLIYGGGHQKGQRSGTENTAGCEALALAAKIMYDNLEANTKQVYEVKKRLWEGIKNSLPDVYINGDDLDNASPFVIDVAFMGLRSEVLLHALEDKKIFVSAGSACNSKKKIQSTVLGAMGFDEKRIIGSVRFSFCEENTVEEADECVEALKQLVPMLRRFNK